MQRFRRQSHCGENNDNEIDLFFITLTPKNSMRSITCSTPLGCLIIPLSSDFSDQLQTEISDYFHGTRYTFSSNLLQAAEEVVFSIGTPFQQSVWRVLMQIPYAATITYSDLAQRIGNPRATRAVAAACRANPFPILIPCHRVVAKNDIGGFALGIPGKQLLLRLESAHC